MARWSAPTARGNGLREVMRERTEHQARFWVDRARNAAERAYAERVYLALAARWTSDEPMDVAAGELPASAVEGIHPNARLRMHGDGTITALERVGGEPARVVDLASRRGPEG